MLSILIGSYKEFIIINILIIIHELGHYLISRIFNVEVDKIYIYPLGGITKLNMDLNINPLKEFIIIIFGPLFQNIAYLILIKLFNKELVLNYHLGILLFNLLPIYPLDGGKLLELLFEKFIPYKKSLKLVSIISYIFILVLLLKTKYIKLNIVITIILLIILVSNEYKKINYKYNKFKLERYLKKYHFKDSKLIFDEDDFYRNNRHLIKINGKYYTENDYFMKKFKKN